MVRNGGDKWFTNVRVDVFFDGETYETTFTDMLNEENQVKDSMSTSVSSSEVGKWLSLTDEIQVQASYRQDSDPEWFVPGSDFKFQIWARTNDIYCSSYVNKESEVWTSTFFYDGEQFGTGIWNFGGPP
jgi:hypothetical protein